MMGLLAIEGNESAQSLFYYSLFKHHRVNLFLIEFCFRPLGKPVLLYIIENSCFDAIQFEIMNLKLYTDGGNFPGNTIRECVTKRTLLEGY